MSPDLTADYPDDVRLVQAIVPDPFFSDTAYSLPSGVYQGPFDCRYYEGTQFWWKPTTRPQRLRFTWFSDAAGARPIGGFGLDCHAGMDAGLVLVNRGHYVGFSVTTDTGANATGDLYVSATTQTDQRNTDESRHYLQTRFVAALGAGATDQTTCDATMIGPALWLVHTAAAAYRAQLFTTDYTGATTSFALIENAGLNANQLIYLPPERITMLFTNNDGAARTFTMTITPNYS